MNVHDHTKINVVTNASVRVAFGELTLRKRLFLIWLIVLGSFATLSGEVIVSIRTEPVKS